MKDVLAVLTVHSTDVLVADWKGFPGVGKHYLSWLEYPGGVGVVTWYGDNNSPTRTQAGIRGEILA